MHPIICKIGPFTIYSYGLMLAIAFGVSLFLCLKQARKEGQDTNIIFNTAYLGLISGIIGGRLFYVIENLSYYFKNPIEIILLQHGGLSWFGALILAFICTAISLKRRHIPIYRVLDLFAPFIALAQAIGRIGCLLNGCCFGLTVIPIQIYSSVILLFIFIILRQLQDRPHREGSIFFSYLLFYSVKRFSVEFWRLDNPSIIGSLTLFHILSLTIFCISCLQLIRLRKSY